MTQVALLRAVNVGGKAVIRMADVRATFEAAGCRDVRTIGHAGNVLFTPGGRSLTAQQTKILAAMRALMGNAVDICFRAGDELRDLVQSEPFGDLAADPSIKLYVVFMDRDPRPHPPLPLAIPREAIEVTAIRGRELFIVSRRKPNGMYGFPNAVAKALGVVSTSRNWNTVVKLARATDASNVEP